ncbi:MAG: hypothetical protein JSW40_07985 [Candidatus Omnitrophota bacterium]|nr:MAG: hypothetical protein JSW40_07985 [Candidatus Omnitrophota bacterium]
MTNWNTLVAEPVKEMLTRIAGFIPTLVGVLIILVVGWIIAKMVRGAVIRLLKMIRFNAIAEKAGISKILSRGEIRITASQLLGALAYWLVMIMVLAMVVNLMGLTVASQLLGGLLAYIPKVIAGLFVLILGLFLGNLVSGIVHTAASNADLPSPEMLSNLSKWAIVIFAMTISLKQLGIAPLLVSTTFNIFFAGVCLALALAFGLGGREMAARYLEELRERHSRKK